LEPTENLLGNGLFGRGSTQWDCGLSSGTIVPVHPGSDAGASESTGDPVTMKPFAGNTSAPILLTYGQCRGMLLGQAKTDAEKWARSGPLNKYCQFHKVADDDLIVETGEKEYLQRRGAYLDTIQGSAGKKNSTRYNHSSNLDKWWYGIIAPRLALKDGGDDGLPSDFGGALSQALTDAGMSYREFAKATGANTRTISDYVRCGHQPQKTKASLIETFEKVLSLPAGTFIKRCRRLNQCPSQVTEQTLLRRQHSAARRAAIYGLVFKRWPERPQKEWRHLTAVASGQIIPFVGYRPGNFWAPGEDVDSAVTADAFLRPFEMFFGFCLKIGYTPERLTIALILDFPLVLKFFEFLRVRNGGTFLTNPAEILADTSHLPGFYTRTVEYWSWNIAALLKPDFGYLWQMSGYAKALSEEPPPAESYLPVSAGGALASPLENVSFGRFRSVATIPSPEEVQWRADCHQAYVAHKDWIIGKRERGEIVEVNAAVEKIEWITDLEEPLVPLIEGANKMEAALPPEPTKANMAPELYAWRKAKRAIAFQDIVIFRMMTAVPLRPKNVRLMTFKGPRPNLFKRPGSKNWWLRYRKSQMKNRKDPFFSLPESLTPYIDEFFKIHRPYLLGPKTKYVFRPSGLDQKRRVASKADAPISKELYQQRFAQFTAQYVGAPGFSPNVMRHIVVTAWLKEDPNGLLVAAAILDDKVDQIEKKYAKLKKQDLYAHFSRFHEITIERVNNGVVSHASLNTLAGSDLEIVLAMITNAKARQQSVAEIEAAFKAVLRSVRSKEAIKAQRSIAA
jgi:hypothetical protein